MCGWCRVSVRRTGITASTTPNGVQFPFSDLLYKRVSPTFYGLPFPSLYCRVRELYTIISGRFSRDPCCKVNILWLKSIVYEIDYCIVIKRNKQKVKEQTIQVTEQTKITRGIRPPFIFLSWHKNKVGMALNDRPCP
jgi:hypothetical protein